VRLKQLTVLTENRVGALAEVASLLGGSGINMESISLESFHDGAVIRLITRDASSARKALARAGFQAIESDVLVLDILDRPGELGKMATKMAREGINIENIYMVSRDKDKTRLALRVNDLKKAEGLFGSSFP
jgi:hypothetical protein